MANTMSKKEKDIYTKLLNLICKADEKTIYYILGYMESEADKTLQLQYGK